MEPDLALQLMYASDHTEEVPTSHHPGQQGPVISSSRCQLYCLPHSPTPTKKSSHSQSLGVCTVFIRCSNMSLLPHST